MSTCEYEVFLSFRGPDTRSGITDFLYTCLIDAGIRAYRDDEELRTGEEIDPGLQRAIEQSTISIPIFSKGYASSTSCLMELVQMVKCMKEKGQKIMPIFYDVTPAEVKYQTDVYGKAFAEHAEKKQHGDRTKKRYDDKIINEWKAALKEVGELKGWDLAKVPNRQEGKLAKIVVDNVLIELKKACLVVSNCLIEVDSQVDEITRMIDAKSSETKIIGIYGLGGIGKTTLAKTVYNRLSSHFKHCCFLSDIGETSRRKGIECLQNQLISDVLRRKWEDFNNVDEGIKGIKATLPSKKVLLLLDNVNEKSQLSSLMGGRDWFGRGSKLIITTRNKEFLDIPQVDESYELTSMDSDHASRLFCKHAFTAEYPPKEYVSNVRKAVEISGGLPLALEVMGSLLHGKKRENWDGILKRLEKVPHDDVKKKLMISIEELGEQQKNIFLDIACFFIGFDKEIVIYQWDGRDLFPKYDIEVLQQMSLIKIGDDNRLWMHDQLRDLGRDIVRQESLAEPERRSRIWDHEQAFDVFRSTQEKKDIKAIRLKFDGQSQCCFTNKAFARLPNLRFLQVDSMYVDKISQHAFAQRKLPQNESFILSKLRCLLWHKFPQVFNLAGFSLGELIILDLSESAITENWVGWSQIKVGENLMIINLSGCYNLVTGPDLSGIKSLKRLILKKCTRLTQLHESVGSLDSLVHLNLGGSTKLVGLPKDISGLKNLEELILSDCIRLKELPEDIDSMKSLKILLLDRTAIAKLPEKIFRLGGLEKLHLDGCASLKQLPDSLGMLESLKELVLNYTEIKEIPNSLGSLRKLELLSLMWCFSLTELPDIFDHLYCLKKLFIDGSNIKELPASIGSLLYLKTLSIGDCLFSRNHPDSIRGLISLTELRLGGKSVTSMPAQLGALKTLRRLEIRNCESLECLPESVGSLSFLIILIIVNASITELPESIGELDNLTELRLNNCKHLHRLPSSMGNLRSLLRLTIKETAVMMLPESTGRLTNLIALQMGKKPRPSNQGLPVQGNPEASPLPFSLSNLSQLKELNARAWYMPGKVHDDFEKLAQLGILDLGYNNFSCLPSSLKGLCVLKKLLLPHCRELKSIPPLPSSLLEVDISDCVAVESISDVSNLENLEELNMANCKKLVDVPGLQHLASLRKLFMIGCEACSSVVKRRISEVSLRNLSILSMPGSEIPDWLSNKEVTCTVQKNLPIKAVLVGVVVSITDEFRKAWGDIPMLVGIQARVLKLDYPIYSTTLCLKGIPTSNGDHVHFCRFLDFHPLVLMLNGGYKVQVAKRDFPGLELKKCGVYLIYERDGDYKGDEQRLDDSYQSVSERLARFFNSL